MVDFLIVVGVLAFVLYRNQHRLLHKFAWTDWTRPVEAHTTSTAAWVAKRRCKKCGVEEERIIGQHPCLKTPCPHREQLDALFQGMPGHIDFLEEELGLKDDRRNH